MGFLAVGTPLTWEDSKKSLQYIREHGVLQFVALYKNVESKAKNDELFWGDEVEYAILETEGGAGESRTVRIALDGSALMTELNRRERTQHNPSTNGCSWHQEYGSWMLEGTPLKPYSGFARDLVEVELNMRLRRARLLNVLKPNQLAPTMTNFPLLGASPLDFTVPKASPGGAASESNCVSDRCINPHPRFATLTANIRLRRGSKVDVRMPLMRDTNTPEFKDWDATATGNGHGHGSAGGAAEVDPLPFHLAAWPPSWPLVRGDCMAFGMGCCCLQVTFQSRDVAESRFTYDQLAGLAPIMLALTAATPLFKGRLMDSDVRWSIISQAVDDRTPTERGATSTSTSPATAGAAAAAAAAAAVKADPLMAGGGVRRLNKSRYDSISCFLSEDTPKGYNDVACEVDEATRALLLAKGMDPVLAHHVGHLFARDPLVLFAGQIEEVPDDGSRTDHWESLQSTNWQTMRWKPPPPPAGPGETPSPHIGWRTEFRSMEVQLSDFENAAFTVFIVLLTRTLLAFDLDLLLPLSKTDDNLAKAHARKPVTTQTFWFRKDVTPGACRGTPQEVAVCEKAKAAQEALQAALEAEMAGLSVAESEKAAAAAAAAAVTTATGAPDGVAGAGGGGFCAAAAARSKAAAKAAAPEEGMFEEMTMGEILGGKGTYFPGLVPLVYAYLDHIQCDRETFKRLDCYLSFILERGTGEIQTDADYIRTFVTSHPDYKQDSVVSPAIVHDLAVVCDSIGRGVLNPPELFGSARTQIQPVVAAEAYGSPLMAAKLGFGARSSLVRRLTQGREPWDKRMERESLGESAVFHQDSK